MDYAIEGTKQKEETYGLIAKTWFDAKIGEKIIISQDNDLGGKSLEKKLISLFPNSLSESKNKARIITLIKSDSISYECKDTLALWLSYQTLSLIPETGFYSMPGLFGWNKIDKGSELLTQFLPEFKGTGADFGCGYGYLSRFILENNPSVMNLYCFDYDMRAVDACKKNITDSHAKIDYADCTQAIPLLPKLDFIIMNPPFHDGHTEDKHLGQKFIETAKQHLKPHGVLWLVANAHLPYEKTLIDNFKRSEKIIEKSGFKIFTASVI